MKIKHRTTLTASILPFQYRMIHDSLKHNISIDIDIKYSFAALKYHFAFTQSSSL